MALVKNFPPTEVRRPQEYTRRRRTRVGLLSLSLVPLETGSRYSTVCIHCKCCRPKREIRNSFDSAAKERTSLGMTKRAPTRSNQRILKDTLALSCVAANRHTDSERNFFFKKKKKTVRIISLPQHRLACEGSRRWAVNKQSRATSCVGSRFRQNNNR